jgi:hypothetical protein
MEKKIIVERETFEKEGKTYFSYFIKGIVRGREVRVGLVPPDRGGYAVLDIVFGDSMSAELALKPYEMKDEVTGRILKGNTYSARVEDNGEVYECKVKPYRNSDKDILNMLLR